MKYLKYSFLVRRVVAVLVIAGSSGASVFGALHLDYDSKTSTGGSPETAAYRITLVDLDPLKFSVNADIPIDGKILEMDDTYPAELPEMAAKGWPALISNLSASDARGNKLNVSTATTHGWELSSALRTRLHLSYDVNFEPFASKGWTSPLESAFVDAENAIAAGRSVFITTLQVGPITVEIASPKGWIPIMPWLAVKGTKSQFAVRSKEDLIDNMLVFSRNKPDVVTAAGFKLQIVPMGHWRPLGTLVRKLLRTIISREVDLMHYKEKEIYDVVLLPISDEGGNAFRQSFVYCFDKPDPTNKAVWANTLAHEIFHYWNYSRLKGASYQNSQWFQEGFTEYVANLVTLKGKIIDADAFNNKLSQHVNNYRKLTTTLENYGTHKGPPLYSAGALVAFMWDLKIRKATGGKRNIGDMFRNLMIQTDSGQRKYTWTDIRAALQSTTEGDWEGFYQSYIRGHQPLPLDQLLPLAGLRINTLADGSERVSFDPAASAEARSLWLSYVGKH